MDWLYGRWYRAAILFGIAYVIAVVAVVQQAHGKPVDLGNTIFLMAYPILCAVTIIYFSRHNGIVLRNLEGSMEYNKETGELTISMVVPLEQREVMLREIFENKRPYMLRGVPVQRDDE